jgi:hypothetical protein
MDILLDVVDQEYSNPKTKPQNLKSQKLEKMKSAQETTNHILDDVVTNTLALASTHVSIQQWEGKMRCMI